MDCNVNVTLSKTRKLSFVVTGIALAAAAAADPMQQITIQPFWISECSHSASLDAWINVRCHRACVNADVREWRQVKFCDLY